MQYILRKSSQMINKKVAIFFFIGLVASIVLSLVVMGKILQLQLDVSSGIKFASFGKSFYEKMLRKNIIKHVIIIFAVIISAKFNYWTKVMYAMCGYTGLKLGMLLVMFVSLMKIKGLLNVFLLYFPHGMFYVTAYYFMFLLVNSVKNSSLAVIKLKSILAMTVVIVFIVFLGIICETYINSYLVRKFFVL